MKKLLHWAAGLLIGLVVLLALVVHVGVWLADTPERKPEALAQPSAAQLRKQQIQALVNHAEAQLVGHIKATMHDPDSFELVGDRAIDAGDHITMVMTYRGRNGFNAVRTERVGAAFDLQGNLISIQKIE